MPPSPTRVAASVPADEQIERTRGASELERVRCRTPPSPWTFRVLFAKLVFAYLWHLLFRPTQRQHTLRFTMLSKLKKRMGRRMYPVQSTPLPENLASGTGEVGIAALLSDGEYQHDEGVIAHGASFSPASSNSEMPDCPSPIASPGLTAVQVAAVAAFHQAIEGNPADDSRQRRSIEQPLSLILHFPHDSQKQVGRFLLSSLF